MKLSKPKCEDNKLTFKTVKLGDKIYELDITSKIPEIGIHKITRISLHINGYIKIECYSKYSTYFIICENEINENSVNKTKEWLFLNKNDCNKKLKEVCIQRIIELSKIIENIN